MDEAFDDAKSVATWYYVGPDLERNRRQSLARLREFSEGDIRGRVFLNEVVSSAELGFGRALPLAWDVQTTWQFFQNHDISDAMWSLAVAGLFRLGVSIFSYCRANRLPDGYSEAAVINAVEDKDANWWRE